MKLITPILILTLLLVTPVAQDSHLEELIARVATLEQKLRNSEADNLSLLAQIAEMRAAPAAPEKGRWFGYKAAERHGAFDMLEVARWEGVQVRTQLATNWSYMVHFRYGNQPPVYLTEAMFKEFANKFDAYLQRTP